MKDTDTPLTVAELLRHHKRAAKDMKQRARHAATSKANESYREFKAWTVFHRRAVELLQGLEPPGFAYWRELVGTPRRPTLAEQEAQWRAVWDTVDGAADGPQGQDATSPDQRYAHKTNPSKMGRDAG